MSGDASQQNPTNGKSVSQAEYLTVKAAAKFIMVSKNTILDAIRDIPGVVRLSERGIRIPKAGLIAWINQMRIVR